MNRVIDWNEILQLVLNATGETLYMVLLAGLLMLGPPGSAKGASSCSVTSAKLWPTWAGKRVLRLAAFG